MMLQKLEPHSEMVQNLLMFASFLPSLLIRKYILVFESIQTSAFYHHG